MKASPGWRPDSGHSMRGDARQASVVIRLDTSFEQVSQDPGFKRRLLWDISSSLRVPQRYIKIAAVDEDGSNVAVHLVLQDVDGDASGSMPRTAGRSAAEMASDLHRQARLPDSALKMGSCTGSVWQVDTPYGADSPSEPPWASAPAAPKTQTLSPPARRHSMYPEATEPKNPMISPPAPRGGEGAAGGRGGRDAGEDWAREKGAMIDEIRKLRSANSELKQELTRARSRSASPWYVSACRVRVSVSRNVESSSKRRIKTQTHHAHAHREVRPQVAVRPKEVAVRPKEKQALGNYPLQSSSPKAQSRPGERDSDGKDRGAGRGAAMGEYSSNVSEASEVAVAPQTVCARECVRAYVFSCTLPCACV
jgi:hypothetical protein